MLSDKHPWQELIRIEHLSTMSAPWLSSLHTQFNFTWIHVLCSNWLFCITLHPFAIFLHVMVTCYWAPCSLHRSLMEHTTVEAFCILAGAKKKMFGTLPVTNGYREANTLSSLPCDSSYLLQASPGGFVWFSTLSDPFSLLVLLPSFLFSFPQGYVLPLRLAFLCPLLGVCFCIRPY